MAQGVQKVLAKSPSPPHKLEAGPHSGPYLLVLINHFYYITISYVVADDLDKSCNDLNLIYFGGENTIHFALDCHIQKKFYFDVM